MGGWSYDLGVAEAQARAHFDWLGSKRSFAA